MARRVEPRLTAGPFALEFYFNCSQWHQEAGAGELNYALVSPQHYLDFYDPFNCECRAYGRLLAEQRTDLAVRAHGYLLLTPDQEAEITTAVSSEPYIPDIDRPILNGRGVWARQEENRYLPIHAILKDLVPDDTEPFTPDQMDGMWRDLQDLHRLGILVRDVRVGNYLGGKLIDFSRAWTAPHPRFVFMDKKTVDAECVRDPHYLREGIIDYARVVGWDWETDEAAMPEGLDECDLEEEGADPFGVDPRLYAWWELEGGLEEGARALLDLVVSREGEEKAEGDHEGEEKGEEEGQEEP